MSFDFWNWNDWKHGYNAVFNANPDIRARNKRWLNESEEEKQERHEAKRATEEARKKRDEYRRAKKAGKKKEAQRLYNETQELYAKGNEFAGKYGTAWHDKGGDTLEPPSFDDDEEEDKGKGKGGKGEDRGESESKAKVGSLGGEREAPRRNPQIEDAVSEEEKGWNAGGMDDESPASASGGGDEKPVEQAVATAASEEAQDASIRASNLRQLTAAFRNKNLNVQVDIEHNRAVISDKQGKRIRVIPIPEDVIRKAAEGTVFDKTGRDKIPHAVFASKEKGSQALFNPDQMRGAQKHLDSGFKPHRYEQQGLSRNFNYLDNFVKHIRNNLRQAQEAGRVITLSDVRHWVGLEKNNGDTSHIPVQFLQQVLDIANMPERDWIYSKPLQMSLGQSVEAIADGKPLDKVPGHLKGINTWDDVLVPDKEEGIVKLKNRTPETAPRLFNVKFAPGFEEAMRKPSYPEAKKAIRDAKFSQLSDMLSPYVADQYNALGGEQPQGAAVGAAAQGAATAAGGATTQEPPYVNTHNTGVGSTESPRQERQEQQAATNAYNQDNVVPEDRSIPADVFRYKPVSEDAAKLGIEDRPELNFEKLRDLPEAKQQRIIDEFNNMNKVWADNANNALLVSDALYLRQQRETAFKNAQSKSAVGTAGDKLQRDVIKKWGGVIKTGQKDWEKARKREKLEREAGHYGWKDMYDAIRGTRGSAIPHIDFSGVKAERLRKLNELLDRGV